MTMPSTSRNQINPKKLRLSKWTAVNPKNKEKHFLVTKVIDPEQPKHLIELVVMEAVSSPPEEKWHGTQKCRRNASCAGQKPVVDWKNDLQIEGAGRTSKKTRRSWALNQMGNPS